MERVEEKEMKAKGIGTITLPDTQLRWTKAICSGDCNSCQKCNFEDMEE